MKIKAKTRRTSLTVIFRSGAIRIIREVPDQSEKEREKRIKELLKISEKSALSCEKRIYADMARELLREGAT